MKKENSFFTNEKIRFQLIILSISFVLFIFLLNNILHNGFLTIIDNKFIYLIESYQNSFTISISKVLSNIFEPVIFLIISILLAMFFIKHNRKKEFISLAVLTIISVGVMQIMKLLVERPRPILSLISENTFSFPSGHALMAVVFFGAIVYLFEKHIRSKKNKFLLNLIGLILIVIIGLSRLLLNVHYFSDILGSILLGTFILTVFIMLMNLIVP